MSAAWRPNLGEHRMPDMFFLSAPGADLVHSLRASLGTERVLWSGRCAVAEYAFEEPASLPRWTLPENRDRLADVKKAQGVYNGINIKLMKSTGMREAHKMLLLARTLGMKVMLGCMTETSCGISAASAWPSSGSRRLRLRPCRKAARA